MSLVSIYIQNDYKMDAKRIDVVVKPLNWHNRQYIPEGLLYHGDLEPLLSAWHQKVLNSFTNEFGENHKFLPDLVEALTRFAVNAMATGKYTIKSSSKITPEQEEFFNKMKETLSQPEVLSQPVSDSHKAQGNPISKLLKEKRSLSRASYELPGINATVELPCDCTRKKSVATEDENWVAIVDTGEPRQSVLRNAIMHLNDEHKWTRERIADWLDELHDQGKINIEFPVPEELEKS